MKKAPPTKAGQKKKESSPRNKLKGILAKRPLEINDPKYPIGACIKDGEGNYIGLRLCGLEAVTIQRNKTHKTIEVTGAFEKRANGKGNLVKCFCVTGLRLSS